jgi:hypothetical protein
MTSQIRLSQFASPAVSRAPIMAMCGMTAPAWVSIKSARKCALGNLWRVAVLTSLGLILGLGISTARAQIVNSALVGTAFDPSGAVVPNAQVTVTNVSTQFTRATVTDSAGHYAFPALPSGSYNLTAVGSGFQKSEITDIILTVGQTGSYDVHFRVGAVSAQVTVQASAAKVDSESAALGQLIGEKQIQDLPLNGRSYVSLTYLGSGDDPQYQNRSSPVMANVGRPDFTAFVSGQRGDANSWLIDGVDTRGYFLGQPNMLISLDAVQEFRVQKNMYDAKYGEGSGIVSVLTKSGTNTFHGSTYEYLRNTSLDAANFFGNLFGLPKNTYTWNQFGASAGGPILKDKLFIFGNYEGFRFIQAAAMSGDDPTAAEWAGNESDLVSSSTMVDPVTGKPAIINPYTGQAFPNGQILSAMLSPVMQKLMPYMPVANANLPGINDVTQPKQGRDDNQGTVRLDWTVGAHDNFFAHYINYKSEFTIPGLIPYWGSVAPIYGQNLALEETHLFSPTLINTFKFGYSRDYFVGGNEATLTNVDANVGLKNVGNTPASLYGLPYVSIAGYTGLAAPGYLQGTTGNTFQYTEELNWVRGRHTMTFGTDIRREQVQLLYGFLENGQFNFDGRYTGNAISDMLIGAASLASAQESVPVTNYRSTQYAFYAQDNIKVTPKLTLNLGLRYEYRQPPYETNGQEGFFDPTIDALRVRVKPNFYNFTLPTSIAVLDPGYQPGIWAPDTRDWGPRVGFAYRLKGNTVLRGGFGIFYSATQGQEIQGKVYMPPISTTVGLTGNPSGVPNVLVDQMFPTIANTPLGTLSPFTIDPHDRTPYVEEWNFGAQHTFGPSTLFEVAYVGSVGKHLCGRYNFNQATSLPGARSRAGVTCSHLIMATVPNTIACKHAWRNIFHTG